MQLFLIINCNSQQKCAFKEFQTEVTPRCFIEISTLLVNIPFTFFCRRILGFRKELTAEVDAGGVGVARRLARRHRRPDRPLQHQHPTGFPISTRRTPTGEQKQLKF